MGKYSLRLGIGVEGRQGPPSKPRTLRVNVWQTVITELPLTLRHTEELERLPAHHGDPHDRLLIAQSRIEGATIVTHDRAFEAYGIPVIWT